MSLNDEMADGARALGADFVGVADLTPVRDYVVAQGGEMLAAYPRAIALGIALPHAIVDLLSDYRSRTVAVQYRTFAYDVINERLNLLASQIAGRLQRAGHRIFPIPAASRVNDERICAVFSHKLAAHLAGLGWIGKNAMLINPQAGPRVRWISILTDAPLEPTGAGMASQCGDCRVCVDSCPVQAFTGEAFRPDAPREWIFAAHKCQTFFLERERTEHLPVRPVCGQCLYRCPYGRQ